MTPAPAERPFPRDLLAGDTLAAARALLGARLVREPEAPGGGRRAGRIAEVEAYIGVEDRASHARMGPTARNRVMFGPPGIAYVYLVYGMHHCLNVVTGPDGQPAAVLIRAVEPLEGLDAMRAARMAIGRGRPDPRDARLASGPGRVAAAFGLDRAFSGADLCDPAAALHLALAAGDGPARAVLAGPRVGIAYAGEPWAGRPWRLALAGSPALSRPIP